MEFEQMYLEYIQEIYGKCSVLMTEIGFMQYGISKDGSRIVIMETYIMPEHRKGYLTYYRLANQVCDIGRANGCKEVWGRVIGSNPNKDAVMGCYYRYGMRHHHNEGQDMWFHKEIV